MLKTILFSSFLLLYLSAQSQPRVTCTVTDNQQAPPPIMPIVEGSSCPIDFSTHDVTAPMTIYVNLHFFPGPNGENFSPEEAYLIGNNLINTANSLLENMPQNDKPGPSGEMSPTVPKAKWKYKIYTEGTPGDDLGGIWFGGMNGEYAQGAGFLIDKVLNIHFRNTLYQEGTQLPKCYAGSSCYQWCEVTLHGIYFCHDDEAWGLPIYAQILNHEIGHSLSLHHVTWSENQCRFRDIDPVAQCGANCPDLTKYDCENPTKILCVPNGSPSCDGIPNPAPAEYVDRCQWDYSNNMLSQSIHQEALTPCQWETTQNFMLNNPRVFASWADNCQDIDSDYSIPSNTTVTWTGLVNLNRNIIIEKDAILNINCEVRLASSIGIIVKQGGKLNINGAKLTSLCQGMPWNGIRVEGDPTQSQYITGKHGRVYILPNSIIENAHEAIKLVDGGMVFSKGTTFKNNKTGITFKPYSNFWPWGQQTGQPRNHIGYINDCQFIWDNDAKGGINAGVEMQGVRGINILGCSFENVRYVNLPTNNNDYGYGIKATDSRFTVSSLAVGPVGTPNQPATTYDHSLFKGLGYGIYVGTAQNGENSTSPILDDFVNVPYTVQQAVFSECIYGIHNRFVSQGTVVNNTFNLGKLPASGPLPGNVPFSNLQIGVFFENGVNGFEFQENLFLKEDGNVQNTYGSYFQNTGWFNNVVRRNTYTNLEVGNFADEINAIFEPNRGLYYLCNINKTKKYDFYVSSEGIINYLQGEYIGNYNFKSAGNVFTKGNPPTGDFENNGPQIRYFHFGNDEKPVYHSGLVFTNVPYENLCESRYCLPPCLGQSDWQDTKLDYNSTKDKYTIALEDIKAAINDGNSVLAGELSDKAATYRLKMDNLANTLSLSMAFDTTTYNLDSVRVWWQKMDSPVSDIVLARDYLAKGQGPQAFNFLETIPMKYNLSTNELNDLTDYGSIMQIMQGETANSLNQDKIHQLLNYANNGKGISAAWAKNILTVNGYHFPPKPKQIESREKKNDIQPSFIAPKTFTISPNPAKDQVWFRHNGTEPMNQAVITITDAFGRIVWRSSEITSENSIIWQTGNTQTGVYFYNIRDASGLTQSGCLSIIK